MLDNNDWNLWSEVKRICGNKAGVINSVDGLTESYSIAKLFAVKYRELYTSVPYNKADMHDIVSSLNTILVDSTITSDSIINFIDVKAAVSRLKPHKRDGCSELSSDNIINVGDDCLIHIACLFSALIVHGTVPGSFGICRPTIVPIPKGHNTNMSDSANFCGIALSSNFGKVFDNIILNAIIKSYHHVTCSSISNL